MKEVDKEAKEALKNIDSKANIKNIKYYGIMGIMIKNLYVDRPVREAIRTYDAQTNELEYIKGKVSDAYHHI